MKLIYIKITGNYRLMLNGLKSIELTPKSTIQLILGTNGSGKSSLLREILPFPAESKDYETTGSKIVKYEYKNNAYLLTSTFSPQKHSFLKNDEELNQGGTLKVQNELIYQHFGLTPQIRDLLISQKKFHAMSPLERRDWFTMMSTVDYGYAIGLYNRFKERYRDTLGALKIAEGRLASELSKIVPKEEINHIKTEIKNIHEILTGLIAIRTPIDEPSSELILKLDSLKENISEVISKSDRIKISLTEKIESEDQLISIISQKKEQCKYLEESIYGLYEEHKKIESDVKILKEVGGSDVQSLKKDLGDKDSKINEIKSSLIKQWNIDNILTEEAINTFNLIKEDLIDIFSSIEINDEGQFSKVKYKELKDRSEKLKIAIEEKENKLKALHLDKDHYDHHLKTGELVCPNCNHRWIKGFDEIIYQNILKSIKLISQEKIKYERLLQTLLDYLGKTSEYFSIYRRYLTIKDKYPILNGFWQYCEKEGISYRYPRLVLDIIQDFDKDIEKFKLISDLNKEKEKIVSLIHALSSVDKTNIRFSENILLNTIKEIEIKTNQVSKLKKEIFSLENSLTDLRKLDKLRIWLFNKLEEANGLYRKTIDTLRMEDVHHFIQSYQISLAQKENIVKQAELKNIVIKDAERQISDLKLEIQTLKILIKEISPTEGLIAEGMLGFINSFTNQMNQVIAKIWSYPMEILPCKMIDGEELDLDYRFPMRVSQVPKDIPDIIAGSVGMREITDLAFKVVAMRYLGLEQFPLFLDEFGSGFDLAHRGTSMQAIRELMLQLSFSQVWMVSHYESSYGSLTDVDICVLDDQNIVVPVSYNQHVTMT